MINLFISFFLLLSLNGSSQWAVGSTQFAVSSRQYATDNRHRTTDNSTTDVHEFHVSKLIVEHSQEDKALQITLHLFIDDLEEALREQGADNLFLCTERESKKADEYLYKYLQQKLKLQKGGQELKFDYVGKEVSEDLQAVWCYLEITDINAIKQLNISNSLLMEIFDDQKNIVNVRIPGVKQGYFLLVKGNSSKDLEF